MANVKKISHFESVHFGVSFLKICKRRLCQFCKTNKNKHKYHILSFLKIIKIGFSNFLKHSNISITDFFLF